MCGIAGLMTQKGETPSSALLQAMGAALRHRGPDGDGHYRAGDVGIVQTRLAIIDLQTGEQPLYEPGGAALVANAEIYNYIELRAALPGAVFSTGSDCETPLHLYRRHGIGFTAHLRGMYAIALHDPAAGRLILARDPFGIKPLYYLETATGFAFASEPSALLAAGLAPAQLVRQVRNELLQLQFTTGRETIFAGIQRLLPGETVVVARGRIVERHLRAALPSGAPLAIDEIEGIGQLDEILADSVLLHQRSDVPYGMFLSGGIDSAAVLAMMARLNDTPVKAFTAGFTNTGVHDEREQARAVAASVGAEHVMVEFGEVDFWRLLPEIVAAVDDPTADYAILPTYKLARRRARSRHQGHPVGRGRRRAVRRLWPLPRRDAAVVGRRADAARTRQSRRARRLARRSRRLARRHRGRRGARRFARPHAAAGGAGDGLRRLAAERPPGQARPLPDGARRRGAHALPRSGRRRVRLPPARRPQGAQGRSANGCCAAGSRRSCRRRRRSPASAASRCRSSTG